MVSAQRAGKRNDETDVQILVLTMVSLAFNGRCSLFEAQVFEGWVGWILRNMGRRDVELAAPELPSVISVNRKEWMGSTESYTEYNEMSNISDTYASLAHFRAPPESPSVCPAADRVRPRTVILCAPTFCEFHSA